MWPIEWHHCQWLWVTLKVTFAVWSLCNSHTWGNIARINYDVYTWIKKHTWLVISTVLSKLKDFSRLQAVTYTVEVVISRKRCKIEMLLLRITNKKRCMTHWIAATRMTFNEFQLTQSITWSLGDSWLSCCLTWSITGELYQSNKNWKHYWY